MNEALLPTRGGYALPLVSCERSEGGTPIWLISFADLIGVLLAFFVLLFSMSHIEPERLREMSGHLDFGREPVPGATGATMTAERNAPQAEVELGEDLGYLGALIKEQLSREELLAATIVRRQGSSIVLSLPTDLLFEPDGAVPTRRGEDALFALVGILRNLPNRVEVEGHADPNPPAAFASNWELSLSRAMAVAVRLDRAGYRFPIIVRGRGDSRFDEVPSALPKAEREALARRVDIVVHEEAH